MSKNIFNSVKLPHVPQSAFDLSHDIKLSFSMGELVPTMVMDCLPGDIVEINCENFLRFAPLIAPVMHKIKVKAEFFFVPNRLLWPNWDEWISGNIDVEAPYLIMSASANEASVGSLCDYLGYPTGDITLPISVSPLQIAAYLKIFDEYYRDQNLQDEQFVPLVDGENDVTAYTYWMTNNPIHRAWGHDYFTSALPFAQKGDEVLIPLSEGMGTVVLADPPTSYTRWVANGDHSALNTGPGYTSYIPSGGAPHKNTIITTGTLVEIPAAYDPRGSLIVDIQETATSINNLRRAIKLQEWLERNARGGTRYIETIWSHYEVKSSDSRLQRPEYIGGNTQNMVISEVLATAQDLEGESPNAIGQMAGHGVSFGSGKRLHYRCEEFGFIIGIISVIPDTAYQQGLHRSFSRLNRLDYAWPTFANIGEQEVLQKEVRANVTPDSPVLSPESVFGYVPRYAEYKFMNSRVAGEFKTTLKFWTLARIFEGNPKLNAQFIASDPSTRIFAVTEVDEDHIYAHVFHNIRAIRKLPKYGIPSI